MTREEIGIFLNLDEGFGWKEAETTYARLLGDAKVSLEQAGSKVERRMAKDSLARIQAKADAVAEFVKIESSIEQARELIARAEEHISNEALPQAAVSLKHLHALPVELLPKELSLRIEELAAEIEYSHLDKVDDTIQGESECTVDPSPQRAVEVVAEEKVATGCILGDVAEHDASSHVAEAVAGVSTPKEADEKAARAKEILEVEAANALRQNELHQEVVAHLDRAQELLDRQDLNEGRAALSSALELADSLDDASEFASEFEMLDGIVRRLSAELSVRTVVDGALADAISAGQSGDKERVLSCLHAALSLPDGDDNAAVWHECCEDQATETAEFMAMRWISEGMELLASKHMEEARKLHSFVHRLLAMLPAESAHVHLIGEKLSEFTEELQKPVVPTPEPCSRLSIEYKRAGQVRRLHIITAETVVFGRSASCDVVVRVLARGGDATLANRTIGRRHFTIENSGAYASVLDGVRVEGGAVEASKNGTFVDGRKVVYPCLIEGRGEILQITPRPVAPDLAHWSLHCWQSETVCAELSSELRSVTCANAPRVAAVYMERLDEMPEDVLILWSALQLGKVDKSLEGLALARSGEGLLLQKGPEIMDIRSVGSVLKLLSLGRLSHIGD